MREYIVVGDKVDVHFSSAGGIFNAEVLHIPCATGAAYHLRTEDGRLVYVQQYDVVY